MEQFELLHEIFFFLNLQWQSYASLYASYLMGKHLSTEEVTAMREGLRLGLAVSLGSGGLT